VKVYILIEENVHDNDGDMDTNIMGAFESLEDLREWESHQYKMADWQCRYAMILDTKMPKFSDFTNVRGKRETE
jgi:hypothetical protein